MSASIEEAYNKAWLDLIKKAYTKAGFRPVKVELEVSRLYHRTAINVTLIGRNRDRSLPDKVREFTLLLSLNRKQKEITIDQWDIYCEDLTRPLKKIAKDRFFDWVLDRGGGSYESVFKNGRYQIMTYWGREPSVEPDPVPVCNEDRYW